MRLKSNINITLIVFWYVIAVAEVALFLYGFFPVKSKSSNHGIQPPSHINNVSVNSSQLYQAAASRVILIVIDALRRDFVSPKNMPYLYSNAHKKRGCVLTISVESPTVTMPRIKSMTTGSVSQFIDIVLNFASSEIVEDSILNQAKNAGKRMVFYGDDTWLKLYPNMFVRSEGTTSFFVSDYTEVDRNVTRHVAEELSRQDWDMLLLHYLGLDHIGHMYGPFNPLIATKLKEMDGIIERIHSTLKPDDGTVLVICGDHGMRDSGGHGGSSAMETQVPLVFLGLPCAATEHRMSAQTDIAATLAALLGLPLPSDNVGRVLPEILASYSEQRQLYMRHYNAVNLVQKDPTTYGALFKDVFREHAAFIRNESSFSTVAAHYDTELRAVSASLIKSSSAQNIPFLYLSCSALTIILLAVLLLPTKQYQYYALSFCSLTLSLIIVALVLSDSPILVPLSQVYCLVPLCMCAWTLPQGVATLREFTASPVLLWLVGGSLFRILSFASTSSIEEEHQTWYYLWGTLAVLGAVQEMRERSAWTRVAWWLALLAGVRVLRHWNHVGRDASLPDVADWLNIQDNWRPLLAVFTTGLAAVVYYCSGIHKGDRIVSVLSTVTTGMILWYRVALQYNDQSVLPARIATMLIVSVSSVSALRHRDAIKTALLVWMLWSCLLMRPHNVPLIPACVAASKILQRLCPRGTCLTLAHTWLAMVLAHCQGMCNSLASIDVSPGYVGLSNYAPLLTAFQVLCHAYSLHVLSILLLFRTGKYSDHVQMLYTIVVYQLASVTWCCAISLLHRQHLFVWSVFSPKLLIEASHTTCLLLVLLLYQLFRCIRLAQRPSTIAY